MIKPRLLDLFCGAGGAAKGYQQAGFYVVGIDNRPMPRYCGDEFIQADALEFVAEHGREFDVIHASPPCQGYSQLRHLPWLKGKRWPKLLDDTCEILIAIGRPWIIENVEGAPLDGFILCGQMFGLPVYRHRKFCTSFFVMTPAHPTHTEVIGHGRMVNDRHKGSLNNSSAAGAWRRQKIITVAGNQFCKADGVSAMQIDWMTKYELTQAIPPAFTLYIGSRLLEAMGVRVCG